MTRQRAELVILDARPWTDGAPIAEADALAVEDGRIVAIGRRSAIAALAGPETVTLDARGATVTPGFTDAHIHLVAWARSRGALELFDCATRAGALARVADHVAAHPGAAVVVGRGWDANVWSEAPHRDALDRVTGPRPVLLHSKDFHSLWVNGAALALAG
ncbi:MAG: amidohydrolase family protein, partial [Candidatus Eiseniibacteriota bacterium]